VMVRKAVLRIGNGPTRALIGVLMASAVLLAASASTASADFGIESFDGSVVSADGSAFTQAGGHPYQAETTIMFNTATNTRGEITPGGSLRDVSIELPAGFIGNPTAVPACQESELVTLNCPIGSQVGLIKIFQAEGSQITEPLFSMVPPPGVPAEFGFVFLGATTHLLASVREAGDYGVNVITPEISESLPVVGTKVTLWGVPGDPAHDAVRDTTCFGEFCLPSGKSAGLGLNPKAFLTNPTGCTPVGVGLETRLSADSWQEPGLYRETSFLSHESVPDQAVRVGPTGCADVPFHAECQRPAYESCHRSANGSRSKRECAAGRPRKRRRDCPVGGERCRTAASAGDVCVAFGGKRPAGMLGGAGRLSGCQRTERRRRLRRRAGAMS